MALGEDMDRALRGRLIVSCQAYPGEPMRDPRTMAQVAASVVRGGASAVRIQGIEDIRATTAVVDVPVIGLWKVGAEGVFITPTLEHALAVARAGADIVALDGTRRPRPDGLDLAETIAAVRERVGTPVMADCGSLADAVAAAEAGADLLSTALAGYTGERPASPGPDLDLVEAITSATDVPVVVEGRIRTPLEAVESLQRGAMAVCVGTAITHPLSITRWFCEALALPEGESA
ncbi:MAG: N-acetylmannosamine-6-phosphate 2-epimerase [Actinomyces sp.]|jgi:N-acylglucosamine-6-phosphate 2-epimerase|nr:N-acetylmannosamine-6-phosphate 2-epimerase [Actinomyces sp.]MCI1787583.1 N-acetylmannosamine-6-phosphate 2-epimerase [Actinomyces sp.]MCI1830209.1 N-acetylmannosamine-6-phosphate 2-epimerase [Actinomyces sp.]